jgi:hypothetical protein
VFRQVDFWTVRGLVDQGNVLWNDQFFGAMPGCLIDLHDNEVLGKRLGDMLQKESHHGSVGKGHHSGGQQPGSWSDSCIHAG